MFSAPLFCAAQMRVLPAAFSLAEPIKEPGVQMPPGAYTLIHLYEEHKDTNHWTYWRMSILTVTDVYFNK